MGQAVAMLVYEILRIDGSDMDDSKYIAFKEATLLAIALSINNIGGGMSAGMIGLNSFRVGFLSALLSFIALWAGNYISEIFINGVCPAKPCSLRVFY